MKIGNIEIKFSYEVCDPKKQYSSTFHRTKQMANNQIDKNKECNDEYYKEYWKNYKWIIKRRIEITF